MSQFRKLLGLSPYITKGLIGWWKFDEGTGSTTVDSSVSMKNGSLVSSPSWVAGKIKSALQFNGTSNYVDILNSSSLADNLSIMTVCAWVHLPNATFPSNNFGIICGKVDSANGGLGINGTGWGLFISGAGAGDVNGAFNFVAQGSTGSAWIEQNYVSSISDGTWHHIAATMSGFSSPSNIILYLDGNSVSTTFSSASTLSSTTNSDNVRIGSDYNSEFVANGSIIDDVRIYNRVLTPAEINKIFNLKG